MYRVADTNYGIPGVFSLEECLSCSLVYLNPRPEETEIAAIYPEESYDPFRAIQAGGIPVPNATQEQRARQITRLIHPGKVLDVGCSDGSFLLAMRKLGWECHGIEPNAKAAEFARRRLSIDAAQGTVDEYAGSCVFDAITFWDVLEHTPSPRKALTAAHRLLSPSGILSLSVPNWDSIERRLFRGNWIALDAPRHVYHFSHKTLGRLLSETGFEPIRFFAHAPAISLASNVLRLGGNKLLRHGKEKTSVELLISRKEPASRARRLVISTTYLVLTPLNALANALNYGATLTLVARKKTTGK